MSITGIEMLEFGVEDLAKSTKFMQDFGLTAVTDNKQSGSVIFETLSGAKVILYHIDDPELPPAFESGSTLRRMTWAVDSAASLSKLANTLADQAGFHRIAEGIECQDPNGMTLRFKLSNQRQVKLDVPGINQWGDTRRIDIPSPLYEKAQPINIGHVVFFVQDLARAEQFYRDKLGFQLSDRYIDRAVFLRTQPRGGHHDLFLLHLPNRPKPGLNHVAFNVRDIHEVVGGGLAMNKQQWSTFIGPGRHPISSAYFWYVNSPTGGAFEYYTNDDYLTENWQARELEHSLTSFTEWAIEGGIDHDTRRQVKQKEAS